MTLTAEVEQAAGALAVRRLQVVLARIGLSSNNPALLRLPRYLDPAAQEERPVIWSFLSALHGATDLPAAVEVDAWVHLLDSPELPPAALVTPERVLLVGDFSTWEREVADRRYTLFGNAGFLSKLSYATLERCYGVLSFHAVAMYDEARHRVYVVIGSAGAGKTVTMFEGTLRRGLRVFATEMTHVGFSDEGCVFYKGSLYDNVRAANLSDFPEAAERLAIPPIDPASKDPKVCLSFRPLEAAPDRLVDPEIVLLFPRIESERTTTIAADLNDRDALLKAVYENASEMILRPRVYYNRLGIGPIEYPGASQRRLELCRRLISETKVIQARTILAGPRDSLAGVV
jgi:hypothetical protein